MDRDIRATLMMTACVVKENFIVEMERSLRVFGMLMFWRVSFNNNDLA